MRPRQQTGVRLERALALAHAGDHVRATKEANAVVSEHPASGDLVYNAACVYSLAITALVKDERALRPSATA
jgi:hypothetical protein